MHLESLTHWRQVGTKETLGYALERPERSRYARAAAAARAALGDDALAAAWAAGRALTVEQAVAEATDLAAELAADPASRSAPAPTSLPAGLTEREADVLRLVALGLTNREVAKRLFLSTRTVDTHLHRVYEKLGVAGRAAATRFAMEHGLA
jgi:DNA-binding NarL/FixJ family response regulator